MWSGKARLLACSALILASGGVAAAQGVVEVDEIIVEGELQQRSVQDTPTGVSVITGEELDQGRDADLYDVIERTPGVTSSFGEKGFAIRGYDQRGPTGGGRALAINTRVDGATLPTNQSTFFGPYGVWDLEQVEVLRGPQSTQSGRNALAGAINIRTTDPTYDFEVKTLAEYASRDTAGGAFALNLPIVPDAFALRFAAERTRTDGYVDNPTLGIDTYDARELSVYRGKALFEGIPGLRVVATLSNTQNEGGEDYVDAAQYPDRRVNFSNVPAIEKSQHVIGSVRAQYELTDFWTVESISSAYGHDYRRIEDFDSTAADAGFLDRINHDESFEQEFLLRFDGDDVQSVLGVYYARVGTEDLTVFDTVVTGIGQVTRDLTSRQTTVNTAVFGELDYRLGGALTLTAGLRYDRETLDTADGVDWTIPGFGFVTPTDPVLDGADFSTFTYDAWLPKIGLTYDWTDDLATSFTVQRGYRAGGTQRNIATSVVNEFDPETSWNYEFALRSQWLDRRLTTNANVFFTTYKDQQVSVFAGTPTTGLGPVVDGALTPFNSNTENAGESQAYGAELEIKAQVTDDLSLFIAAAYLNTEFTEFVSNGVDLSGNEFPDAPNVTFALGGEYAFLDGFFVAADASYQAKAYTDGTNDPSTQSSDRFLVNAAIGYGMDNWKLKLYGRNLFDQDYITQNSANTQFRTGEPLTAGVILTTEW